MCWSARRRSSWTSVRNGRAPGDCLESFIVVSSSGSESIPAGQKADNAGQRLRRKTGLPSDSLRRVIEGRATPQGTKRFASRSGAADGHFRDASGLSLSSIGLGTYLGPETSAADAGYESSVGVALSSGVNVFDTAINYRGQKSERAIGRALAA